MGDLPSPAPLRILVVCTANACRSPVAERLLERHLATANTPAIVSSAGTRGGRLPVHGDTIRAASASVNVDLLDHRSRLLTADLVEHDGADLVITMTREQLRDVVALSPDAWPRSFTLKELVRRGFDVPTTITDLGEWRRVAGEGRRTTELLQPDPADDVADPYGAPYESHLAMVAEINALTSGLARVLPSPTVRRDHEF